jgi:hypothetical protein
VAPLRGPGYFLPGVTPPLDTPLAFAALFALSRLGILSLSF